MQGHGKTGQTGDNTLMQGFKTAQGGDGLTLGAMLWHGKAQGSNGLIFHASSLDELQNERPNTFSAAYPSRKHLTIANVQADTRDTMNTLPAGSLPKTLTVDIEPQGFRMMLRGKMLSSGLPNMPNLEVTTGSDHKGMVLFDTCYANFTHAPDGDFASRITSSIKFKASSGGQNHGAVIWSNQLPVLVDAFDYGWFNAFQWSAFAIDQENSPTFTKSARDVLAGEKKASQGNIQMRRFITSVANCTGENCIMRDDNLTITIWDKIYEALTVLADGNSHNFDMISSPDFHWTSLSLVRQNFALLLARSKERLPPLTYMMMNTVEFLQTAVSKFDSLIVERKIKPTKNVMREHVLMWGQEIQKRLRTSVYQDNPHAALISPALFSAAAAMFVTVKDYPLMGSPQFTIDEKILKIPNGASYLAVLVLMIDREQSADNYHDIDGQFLRELAKELPPQDVLASFKKKIAARDFSGADKILVEYYRPRLARSP
jgi:hypothetical protein